MTNFKIEIMDESFIHSAQKLIEDKIKGMIRDEDIFKHLLESAIKTYILEQEGLFKQYIKDILTDYITRSDMSNYMSHNKKGIPILDPHHIDKEAKRIIKTRVEAVLGKIIQEKLKFDIQLRE